MAATASRVVKLFGTEQEDAKGRVLMAGPLAAVLDNGMLRYIKLGDIEVMRAIAFLVRDENWGTFAPEISNLKVAESVGAFTVSYDARCHDAMRSIRYHAEIACSANGGLTFDVTAKPDTDVLTNRTGFIVLHPLKGVAGHPLTVEHVDGRKVRSEFPALIDPDCPFRDVRSLTHQVAPGLDVTCRMEDDGFEMEDHRNWTDASFKTYVRALAKPWPYTLPAGQEFKQSVSLTFSAQLPAPAVRTGARSIEVHVGDANVGTMPRIGLGLPADEAAPSLAAAALIRSTGVKTIIAQFDGRRADNAQTAVTVAKLAAEIGAEITAEIILPGKASTAEELQTILQALATASLKPAAVMVSPAPHLKAVLPGSKGPDLPSYEAMYGAVRAAFPGVKLGGGMFSYFTELNRNRPPAELLDFVSHTTCPIVHAADDVSVMETLEALPYVIQSTRAFINGKPYHVGPSAIPARDNPYGAASADNPGNGRVCLAKMDPRQRGLFGAAWTLGYIAALAKGGIAQVTIGAPTGPSGIIARKTSYPQPYFDEPSGPAVYPVYHIVAGLAAAAGGVVLSDRTSDPARLATLVLQAGGKRTLWLANLTGQDKRVAVDGLAGQLRMIDESAFAAATTTPGFFGESGSAIAANATFTMPPYAVARLQ